MTALPTTFWHGWILIITLVSLAAMLWLVLSVYFSSESGSPGHSEKDEKPRWDETLEEGPHPPPLWWFWLILGSTVFSLLYLMLYPGLGSYSGLLDWSQGRHAVARQSEFDARFGSERQRIASLSLIEIQHDGELMAAAERIYQRECAACHGPEARGQVSMFPNLMDVDWQWGASPEAIEQSIRHGRTALMPPWGELLGEAQVQDVAAYVLSLQNGDGTDLPGRAVFEQYCVACHGADATGTPALGAPNLTDRIWLYGGDPASIVQTITNGRNGQMPPFNHRLDDTQIHLLTALLAR